MKNFLSKIAYILNYLISWIWIFYFIIILLVIIQIIAVFDNFNYILVLIAILPVLGFWLYMKMFKNSDKKALKVTTKIIGTVLTFLFFIVLEFAILWDMPYIQMEPSLSQYKNSVQKLKELYNKSDLSYFPTEIPQNATNYYFYVGRNFDGYNIYYLKFDVDKQYISDLIKKYNNEFSTIGTKNELYKKGLDIDINELQNDYKMYLLKQRSVDSCNNCKYGFAINQEDNTIYIFFQNY